jgi:hypothetical protein
MYSIVGELTILFPIFVTDDGMVTLVKFAQFINAEIPMVSTDNGKVMLVKLEQLSKAKSSIVLIVEDNVTLVQKVGIDEHLAL